MREYQPLLELILLQKKRQYLKS